MNQQFSNKSEALDALIDMHERADKADTRAAYWPESAVSRADETKSAEQYRAEAARIRSLLPPCRSDHALQESYWLQDAGPTRRRPSRGLA